MNDVRYSSDILGCVQNTKTQNLHFNQSSIPCYVKIILMQIASTGENISMKYIVILNKISKQLWKRARKEPGLVIISWKQTLVWQSITNVMEVKDKAKHLENVQRKTTCCTLRKHCFECFRYIIKTVAAIWCNGYVTTEFAGLHAGVPDTLLPNWILANGHAGRLLVMAKAPWFLLLWGRSSHLLRKFNF